MHSQECQGKTLILALRSVKERRWFSHTGVSRKDVDSRIQVCQGKTLILALRIVKGRHWFSHLGVSRKDADSRTQVCQGKTPILLIRSVKKRHWFSHLGVLRKNADSRTQKCQGKKDNGSHALSEVSSKDTDCRTRECQERDAVSRAPDHAGSLERGKSLRPHSLPAPPPPPILPIRSYHKVGERRWPPADWPDVRRWRTVTTWRRFQVSFNLQLWNYPGDSIQRGRKILKH